ncbi:MAG: NAD-dependent deacetylase [Salinarimonadaceae bacterium]|nr:MAG: NAD-dependent deacetylase [Salinarimonadaceae bacterium]
MSGELETALDRLREWLADARAVVGFTGAGVSTESGVPDFRSPDSPWMRNPPIPFREYLESAEARREAWRRKFVMDDIYRGAQPSRGHAFVAGMIRRGRMPAVITQNIDGLHQAAGAPDDRVIELHGNGGYAKCLACGARHEIAEIRDHFERWGDPPDCRDCGGVVKSATVSFGQPLPQGALRLAMGLAHGADVFLVMGSSLAVAPAAQLPVVAKRNGARLVIVNREPTPLDAIADLAVRTEIGPMMDRLARGE